MVTNIVRRSADDPVAALERNRAEDARLMQRINAAAATLHRLWSTASAVDSQQPPDRRAAAAAAALQTEIGGLYEADLSTSY